jgi:membrane associated rhomboid family serine protease
MGIETRDYYRNSGDGRWADWGLYSLTPVVKWLIIANIVVFVLQIVITREVHVSPLDAMRKVNPELDKALKDKDTNPEAWEKYKKKHPELDRFLDEDDALDPMFNPPQKVSIIQEWCELDTRKVVYEGQVWRLLTHAFCHDRYGIFHIFFNMLFLYWFGCTIESMYGSREFLLFYLTSAVVAGLAFVGLDLYTGSAIPGIGASGAVMAVTMLYAVHFPREPIYVFWLIRVEMRWLIIFYVIFDLHPVLLALAGEHMFTGIANAAHLGGLAFGFVYGWYQWRLAPLVESVFRLRWPRRGRLRLVSAPLEERRPAREPDPEMSRLDQLLQKIGESGQASLTDEEMAFLRKTSERMKNRSHGG